MSILRDDLESFSSVKSSRWVTIIQSSVVQIIMLYTDVVKFLD